MGRKKYDVIEYIYCNGVAELIDACRENLKGLEFMLGEAESDFSKLGDMVSESVEELPYEYEELADSLNGFFDEAKETADELHQIMDMLVAKDLKDPQPVPILLTYRKERG